MPGSTPTRRRNGLKVKLFQTTFTSAILAVQQKKADLTMDIYYTPDRAKSLYYTYPFSVEGLQVFTKNDFKYTGPGEPQGTQGRCRVRRRLDRRAQEVLRL